MPVTLPSDTYTEREKTTLGSLAISCTFSSCVYSTAYHFHQYPCCFIVVPIFHTHCHSRNSRRVLPVEDKFFISNGSQNVNVDHLIKQALKNIVIGIVGSVTVEVVQH